MILRLIARPAFQAQGYEIAFDAIHVHLTSADID
jgi:hypothetical protein